MSLKETGNKPLLYHCIVPMHNNMVTETVPPEDGGFYCNGINNL